MINQLQLVSGYKLDGKYGESFNRLATTVFGIDFRDWYEKGFWSDRYVCHSYVDGKKVIANVSTYKMDMVIAGEQKTAIQIGTVMTDPAYRGNGLAAKLMLTVLAQYERSADFTFLFANESVRDFYPKFGFRVQPESRFSIAVSHGNASNTIGMKQLHPATMPEDLQLILGIFSKRKLSPILDVIHTEPLLSFYCLSEFCENIYYLQPLHSIAIFRIVEGTLHLYDVIRSHDFPFRRLMDYLGRSDIQKVVFHFTPDFKDLKPVAERKQQSGNTNMLFVKSITDPFPETFTIPILAHS